MRIAQRDALYSTVHGAGRVMSRTAAAGKRNRRTGRVISPGRVSPEMMSAWVKEKGVILRGGGLDESPHAYRRLPDGARGAAGDGGGPPHAPAARRGDGRRRGVRSLQGLILGRDRTPILDDALITAGARAPEPLQAELLRDAKCLLQEHHRPSGFTHGTLMRRRRADRRQPALYRGAHLLLEDDELAPKLALVEAHARTLRTMSLGDDALDRAPVANTLRGRFGVEVHPRERGERSARNVAT